MSQINLSSLGLDRIIDELDELSRAPSPRQVAAMDLALARSFADTQAQVHVDTGALKASGRMSSEVDQEEGTWTGSIQYGGPQAPHAVYEVAEGGSHDPFNNLPTFEELFEEALTEGMP